MTLPPAIPDATSAADEAEDIVRNAVTHDSARVLRALADKMGTVGPTDTARILHTIAAYVEGQQRVLRAVGLDEYDDDDKEVGGFRARGRVLLRGAEQQEQALGRVMELVAPQAAAQQLAGYARALESAERLGDTALATRLRGEISRLLPPPAEVAPAVGVPAEEASGDDAVHTTTDAAPEAPTNTVDAEEVPVPPALLGRVVPTIMDGLGQYNTIPRRYS